MPVASHPKDHIPPMCGQYGELAWRYLTLGDVGKSQSDSGDFCRSEVKWGFEITTHAAVALPGSGYYGSKRGRSVLLLEWT